MHRMVDHVKRTMLLSKIKFDLQLAPKFSLEQITAAVNAMEGHAGAKNLDLSFNMQKEILTAPESISFWIELDSYARKGHRFITQSMVTKLVNICKKNGTLLCSNNLRDVIWSFRAFDGLRDYDRYDEQQLKSKAQYVYLSILRGRNLPFHERYAVRDLVYWLYAENAVPLKLDKIESEDQLLILTKPWFTWGLGMKKGEVLELSKLFWECSDLVGFVNFFYQRNIKVSFSPDTYAELYKNLPRIQAAIEDVWNLVGHCPETMQHLLHQWEKMGCHISDLEYFEQRIKNIDPGQIIDCVYDGLNYLVLMNPNYFKLEYVERLSASKQELLTYAILNRKKAFLQLIQDNLDLYNEMTIRSVLFEPEFYNEYLNINILNRQNLLDFSKFKTRSLEGLQKRLHTFEEIKLLIESTADIQALYYALGHEKVDERIKAIRPVVKYNLLANQNFNNDDIQQLAARLTQKSLYDWMSTDFSHIKGLTREGAIALLVVLTHVEHLVPAITDEHVAALICRNAEAMKGIRCIKKATDKLISIDSAWIKLKNAMDLSNEFCAKNKHNIFKFLSRDGAGICYSYWATIRNMGYGHRTFLQNYAKVIKSELAGEFHTIKYFDEDLRIEISYPISAKQKSTWITNSTMSDTPFIATEVDDFFSTMLVGATPRESCLYYRNGNHRECLLSSFDSNKKIIHVMRGDTVVARAFIRLTKGSFHERYADTFEYADIESLTKRKKMSKEDLVLFLEEVYFAGITDDEHYTVKKLLVKLVEQKAEQLGAMPVLSLKYLAAASSYVRVPYYMYISKSKAGPQYLDSMGGTAESDEGGSYRSYEFCINAEIASPFIVDPDDKVGEPAEAS